MMALPGIPKFFDEAIIYVWSDEFASNENLKEPFQRLLFIITHRRQQMKIALSYILYFDSVKFDSKYLKWWIG